MKRIDVGQAIQILANFGVLAGIVFLGYELRQNTDAVQADTFQGLVESSASYLENLARDSETWSIVERASANPEELSKEEVMRLTTLVRAQWLRYQGAYQHWRRGSLSPEDWRSYERALCGGPPTQRSQAVNWSVAEAIGWRAVRATMIEEFLAFAESCRPDLAQIAGTSTE